MFTYKIKLIILDIIVADTQMYYSDPPSRKDMLLIHKEYIFLAAFCGFLLQIYFSL
jgi:hypothetical protein